MVCITVKAVNPETLDDVASKETSPVPSKSTEPSVERLCEYDPGGQSGCRRTKTILDLEADFNTFVDPEMIWGVWDIFCKHDGHSYFYKNWITDNLKIDQSNLASDSNNLELNSHIETVTSYFGEYLHNGVTFEFVTNLFRNPPAGFPTLVSETPNFFQCINPETVISIDDLNNELLTKIKNTFIDDVNPLLANLSNRLYLINGDIYCYDCLAFEQNNNKLGIIMIANDSIKYQNGNTYFFPFNTLTTEQETAIKSLALLEADLQGEVVIVTL